MLVELGAVSDLLDWTEKIAAVDPACVPFVAKVRQLAKRGEFDEIQSMIGGNVAASGGSL